MKTGGAAAKHPSRPRRTHLHVALRALVAAGLGLAACARIRPLEGGPPDREPPRLLQVTPRDSTCNLSGKPVFELQWSEDVDGASLRRAIRFQPALRIAAVDVRGARARITLADSLPSDATVVLIVGRTARDAVPRDNAIPSEIVLTYATGSQIRGASLFGQVTVQGKADARAAVVWRPLQVDTLIARRARLPVAVVDAAGNFHLAGLPAEVPARLIGFLDRNGDLQPDEDEQATAYPETLRLAPQSVRRGMQWNILDPNLPGTVQGVVQNRSGVTGPVAVAIYARSDRAAVDSAAARADTLRPAALPVPPRTASPYASAYATLEPRGYVRREWVVVYASPRGDYSMKVPPGRHVWVSFVDARRDSAPGLHLTAGDSALAWEPLSEGGQIDVEPGGTLRLRSLEIGPGRGADAGRNP